MIKHSYSDRIFLGFVYVYLTVALLVVLYPLLFIVSASFSSPQAVTAGRVWLFPVEPSLAGYEAVFDNRQIMTGFANSFFYMIVGTIVNVTMTMLAGFPLSRKEFVGRNLIMALFVFTMLFSGGLVPLYLVVLRLGIVNTRAAMILPTALSVWNVIITRTYLKVTIPDQLYEATQLDGCGDFSFFLRIVLPLSAPIVAVNGLFYGVFHWNSYFNALIFLKNEDLYPIQLVLRNILILNRFSPSFVESLDAMLRKQGLANVLKYSTIVVASVPLLLLYPFVQRFFVRGIMIGALKG